MGTTASSSAGSGGGSGRDDGGFDIDADRDAEVDADIDADVDADELTRMDPGDVRGQLERAAGVRPDPPLLDRFPEQVEPPLEMRDRERPLLVHEQVRPEGVALVAGQSE